MGIGVSRYWYYFRTTAHVHESGIRKSKSMSVEQERAEAFVARLAQNPTLSGFTSLQREEQILQFLNENAGTLAPTLASQQFFPGRAWQQIYGLLAQALIAITNRDLIPEVEELVGSRMDLSFIQLLRQQNVSQDTVKEQVIGVVKEILQKLEGRRAFAGAHAALSYRLVDRYLELCFTRRSYVHFELTKVQRLKFGKDQTKSMIELSLLLKPAIYLVSAGNGTTGGETGSGVVLSQFAEKAFQALKKPLSLLPEPAVKSAVNANTSFQDNRYIEATSRLAAIFAARGRNYKPIGPVDRGADSPDKSWLFVARRNYKFYGFDIKMIDELYSIAAENRF